MAARAPLLEWSPEEIAAALAAHGTPVPVVDARRLLTAALGPPGAVARPASRRARAAAAELFATPRLAVVDRAVDPADGFVKLLFEAPDGARFEAVRIPLHQPGRFSVCLSSQVGCAMACAFCATGRLGLTRNLEAWEMLESFRVVRDEAPGRVTGAVFMGQGEPFQNYDRVLRAARQLSHPSGGRVAAKAITISTVGLVPAIRRYTAEGHRYRLAISLTSAVPARRAALLPVAGRVPLDDLVDAIRAHAAATGDRVTVAWVVLGGVNTGADEVAALRARLAGVPLRLNLIDVNDPRADGFRRATAGELDGFRDALQVLGVPIVRRYSGGAARDAACGMLAARAHG